MKQSLCLLLFGFLAACSSASAQQIGTPPGPSAVIVTDSPTPTVTALPTSTLTAASAMYPYTIRGLRSHEFQSGAVRIREKTLEDKNFTRFLIEYPSDGLTITGVLQIPTSGKPPYPVIVMNHGFFSRTVYSSGDGTDRAAEFLNRRGYLTVSSDYRSWGGSDNGMSLFYSGLAVDVINLMNALPSIPQADPQRIGMWGHSMGGGVTLRVLTVDPRVKAAVLYSSVSADFADIIERWGPGCLGDPYQGEVTVGCNSSDILSTDAPPDLISAYFEAVTDPVILKAASPINYLDFVTGPVQITYGTDDGKTSAGTPPAWSKKMYDAFIEADKNARIFGHQGEGHSLLYTEWFAFMERSGQFFDKYVK